MSCRGASFEPKAVFADVLEYSKGRHSIHLIEQFQNQARSLYENDSRFEFQKHQQCKNCILLDAAECFNKWWHSEALIQIGLHQERL